MLIVEIALGILLAGFLFRHARAVLLVLGAGVGLVLVIVAGVLLWPYLGAIVSVVAIYGGAVLVHQHMTPQQRAWISEPLFPKLLFWRRRR